MPALDGQVVVVTGAGRGLGREYALLAASEGASVVVNDLGCEPDGSGSDPALAQAVAADIVAAGGAAVASADDVATMDGAAAVLDLALAAFGPVDGLVSNAGVLRDRMFVNMSEQEWDDVVRGQLRTTFCMTRTLAGHWRDRSKAGESVAASVVAVSSTSGLVGAPGQSNYGAAKAGIAAMAVILAGELARYGTRVNAITPVARTRMTEDVPGIKDIVAAPASAADFDVFHPANVAPLVVWLLSPAAAAVTGQTFYAKGGEIRQFLPWKYGRTVDKGARWTVAELDEAMTRLLEP